MVAPTKDNSPTRRECNTNGSTADMCCGAVVAVVLLLPWYLCTLQEARAALRAGAAATRGKPAARETPKFLASVREAVDKCREVSCATELMPATPSSG